jgi:DegV family protein with EDD domain
VNYFVFFKEASMAKIGVITDTGAYLPKDLVKQHGLTIIPQIVIWGSERIRDGVDINADEFHERLRTDPVHPTTTQANPEDFLQAYQELGKDHDGIVAVCISSVLSGTVNSATIAADDYDKVPVRVVDTLSVSMGQGFAAIAAARAAAKGAGIDEVENAAIDMASRARILFAVDTLEYLHKGGRIGGASRLLGTALSLKPLLHLNEGRVDALEKVRTKAKAINRLLELISQHVDNRSVCAAVIHADVPEEAQELKARVKELLNCTELHVAELSPAIAVHAGPGTLGVVACPE